MIEWLNGEKVAIRPKGGMTGVPTPPRTPKGPKHPGLATTGVGLETIALEDWPGGSGESQPQGIAPGGTPLYSDWLAWYRARPVPG